MIASMGEWHPLHEAARAALARESRRLIAHAAFETVSAGSRMPEPYRVPPGTILASLDRDYPSAWLSLDANQQRRALETAVARGLHGGALYDALIAATAAEQDVTLLSADRRATVAYEAMGARVEFLQA
jgi:predicted nucleic acid-binding protein